MSRKNELLSNLLIRNWYFSYGLKCAIRMQIHTAGLIGLGASSHKAKPHKLIINKERT